MVQTDLTTLERYGWEVMDRTAYGPTLTSIDFQQLIGKRFVKDADVKQDVTSCPQTFDSEIFSAGICQRAIKEHVPKYQW
jgi:hypothetical protein